GTKESEEAGDFQSKGVFARIATIAAGPIFNFILAFVFAVILIRMEGYDTALVTEVKEESAAYEAGIRAGDEVISYRGKKIRFYEDLYMEQYIHPETTAEPIMITVKRENALFETEMKPKAKSQYILGFDYEKSYKSIRITAIKEGYPADLAGMKVGDNITAIDGIPLNNSYELADYLKGNPIAEGEVSITYISDNQIKSVVLYPEIYESYQTGISYGSNHYTAKGWETVRVACYQIEYYIKATLKSLYYLITGKISTKQLTGPVGLIKNIKESVSAQKTEGKDGLLAAISSWIVLISANLGVMNLLPIPALDGGRLVFLFVEAIRRKPVDPKKEAMIHGIGFYLLMFLMIYVLFQDIRGLF
ncbi:MAG: RIP metalloprotease RseP, partial [Lachnospiraceae bacterium]|nr:RIP metalloprotease RseP [Lachnospiraceae bacterium]